MTIFSELELMTEYFFKNIKFNRGSVILIILGMSRRFFFLSAMIHFWHSEAVVRSNCIYMSKKKKLQHPENQWKCCPG